MNSIRRFFILAVSTLVFTSLFVARVDAVDLRFVGSQYDIGGTFFPGAGPANEGVYWVVPWRSELDSKPLDGDGNDVYGSEGYALFATTFTYPDARLIGGEGFNPQDGENDLLPNIINTPTWVADSQILSKHSAGGWEYSLIDDPLLVNGYRDYNWGDTQDPPSILHSQSPYVKLGILDGSDVLDNDPATTPTGRWGFEVGADAPATFRLGVMTEGLNDTVFAAGEVFLTHVVNEVPMETISSGQLIRNRFVDMHLFDITGAQPGDQFVVSAMKAPGDPGHGTAGISGIAFDIVLSTGGTPGDYNNDGTVNAADYTVWRDNLGTGVELLNRDPTNSGDVNQQDYDFWKSQFGMGGGGAVSAVVPEPATAVFVLVATLLIGSTRRGKRS